MNFKLVLKIILLIVFSLSLYLILFDNNSVTKLRNKGSKQNHQDNIIEDTLDAELSEGSSKAVSMPVKDSLNLKVNNIYLINFSLKVTIPPELRKRQKLIAKFNKKTVPATGWAIAIRRVESSTRFEVYLQDSKENGGWFTFAAYDFLPNQFYEVTFIIDPGNFIAGYLKKEGEDENSVTELGTLPLHDMLDIESVDNLQITSGNPKYDVFSGAIKNVSIFNLADLPSKKNLLKSISTGSDKFLETISKQCVISFSNKKYQCEIEH